ncbi:MAG: ABC transporter ATP-binding protein [Gammaproteobacteria bacterium]|nr:MAG: ABC transporter ATP-binding protein [Gammaproteobacteria bacterium]
MSTILDINSIECRYKDRSAVKDLSLQVEEGDLVCLLGPSGCGKTTVLRAIAGFEPLLVGSIALHGEVISKPGFTVQPEKRNLGMVFQDYALFPHMDVCSNVSFGIRNISKIARRHISTSLLRAVGLGDMADRFPHELSGGQQQRVALARALASQPDIILLDEPFSNLDVDLRERLGADVRRILKGQNITGVLVTHDQNEALALADYIGVMHEGHILQWDTPYNLYHKPDNRFVADFIGQGVFLSGTLRSDYSVETEFGIIENDHKFELGPGTEVDLLMRPDDVVPDSESDLHATVIKKAFKGAETLYTLRLPTGSVVLSMFPSHQDFAIGTRVGVRIAADHVVAFPKVN